MKIGLVNVLYLFKPQFNFHKQFRASNSLRKKEPIFKYSTSKKKSCLKEKKVLHLTMQHSFKYYQNNVTINNFK